jgi:hypothetical protein
MNTCCARVRINDWHSGNCGKDATVERDGKWYCRRHDPEVIKAKRAKSEAKYEARQKENMCKKDGCHYVFKTYGYEKLFKFCPFCGTPK